MCHPGGKRSLARTSGTVGPEAKRRRPTTSKKSVGFSNTVGMRRYEDATAPSASWITTDDIEQNKRRAKALSRLHHHAHSKDADGGDATTTVGEAVRAEIAGESLRGMEHLAPVIGRERRRVRNEAVRAVAVEQLLAAAVDTAKLAEAYGSKAREALAYAKSVAEEEAKVAAAILTEDLQSESPSSPPNCSLSSSCDAMSAAFDVRVAAEILRSFLPDALSRRQNLVTVQA